jgi:hypothetical protein
MQNREIKKNQQRKKLGDALIPVSFFYLQSFQENNIICFRGNGPDKM